MRTLDEFDFKAAQKPRRGGPKKGSVNAIKNGSKINLQRLIVGEFPDGMRHIRRQARMYRRTLEAEVLKVKGEVNLVDAHYVDTATAATAAAGICRWLLKNKLEKMTVRDIALCSGNIVKNKEKRDAAVKALDLTAPPPDPWADMDLLPIEDEHDQHECSQDGEAVHEETETSTQETEEEDDHGQD